MINFFLHNNGKSQLRKLYITFVIAMGVVVLPIIFAAITRDIFLSYLFSALTALCFCLFVFNIRPKSRKAKTKSRISELLKISADSGFIVASRRIPTLPKEKENLDFRLQDLEEIEKKLAEIIAKYPETKATHILRKDDLFFLSLVISNLRYSKSRTEMYRMIEFISGLFMRIAASSSFADELYEIFQEQKDD